MQGNYSKKTSTVFWIYLVGIPSNKIDVINSTVTRHVPLVFFITYDAKILLHLKQQPLSSHVKKTDSAAPPEQR